MKLDPRLVRPLAAAAALVAAGATALAVPAQQSTEPPALASPRAQCGPGSHPEPSIQGRVPRSEVDSGRADRGYWCNLTAVGHSGRTGGFRVHRYVDRAGHECAYYDTTLLFPTNAFNPSGEPTGVAVLDMSDPRRPVRTATLVTPAMQSPHESVSISVQRGILAAVMGNPVAHPGGVDVYDISQDCRQPRLTAAAFPGTPFGHEGAMSPDGLTYYPTSPGTRHMSAVDLSNPMLPRTLVTSNYNTHGLSISDDGRRGYLATLTGLAIVDLSEVQDRKPNPQIREISRLTWSNMTIPQVAIPVTIRGRPYLIEVDEFATAQGGNSGSGLPAANGPRVGAARIIDIADERRPRVVSNIRLQVHQPEHRAALANDYGSQSSIQGYAAHYCNVPQRREPGIVACSMISSGLRVFDIRDPLNPKEIAYYVAPPSTISETGGQQYDERSNFAMSQPSFAPERGEIWYSDGTSGMHVLRMDPRVWPFGTAAGGARGCQGTPGFASAGARMVGRRLALPFARNFPLPVRTSVYQVSTGRRVLRQRLVARFENRARGVLWNGVANRGPRRRVGAGQYVVSFIMLRRGRLYDNRRLVLYRDAAGRFVRQPNDVQRGIACGLLVGVRVDRPVFGGTTGVALSGSYRVSQRSTVTVTVTRGRRVVKRFRTARRTRGRTFRFALPAAGLPRGLYTVRVLAHSGDDQAVIRLTARRL